MVIFPRSMSRKSQSPESPVEDDEDDSEDDLAPTVDSSSAFTVWLGLLPAAAATSHPAALDVDDASAVVSPALADDAGQEGVVGHDGDQVIEGEQQPDVDHLDVTGIGQGLEKGLKSYHVIQNIGNTKHTSCIELATVA